MSKLEMIKKLSTSKIMGKKPRLNEGEKSRVLYQVVGIASGRKTGEHSEFGPWCALTGNFAAVNLASGEEFRSGVLFLPDVALDPIIGHMDTGATSIEFGYTISIMEDEKSATGYVYTATPIMEPDENDPLEKLTNQFEVSDEVKKLQAAKVEPVEADEASDEPAESVEPADKKPAVKKATVKK